MVIINFHLCQCDIFIYVSCAQTALLDSKEYLAPVITPFEALLAFNRYYIESIMISKILHSVANFIISTAHRPCLYNILVLKPLLVFAISFKF